MAKWFGKDTEGDLPPELKDLTPAQIVERLKAAQVQETELTANKTKLAELEPKASEADQLRERIKLLEANQRTTEAVTPTERRGPTSFLEDEDKAFAERSAPLAAYMLTVGAQVARSSFLQGMTGLDKQIFGKYGAEVETLMKSEPPANQANPQAWANAWNMIKGKNLTDITKAAQDKTDFFSETSSGTSGAGPAPGVSQDENPTTDEVLLAKKYGVDPKEYVKQRKEMKVYHG